MNDSYIMPEPWLSRLRVLADPERAREAVRFFKTGTGEYGAGDRFIGVAVPPLRKLAREAAPSLGFEGAQGLLASPWHEERLLGLLIWVRLFERGDVAMRERIYHAYLGHTNRINNWDLVDVSAPHIVGAWLAEREHNVLDRLADSALLWERRIALLATFHFIRSGKFADSLRLCEKLLGDREDLIHKAAGWMLREVGKRDKAVLKAFLRANCRRMPRTMLRYAIEKFPAEERRRWLAA